MAEGHCRRQLLLLLLLLRPPEPDLPKCEQMSAPLNLLRDPLAAKYFHTAPEDHNSREETRNYGGIWFLTIREKRHGISICNGSAGFSESPAWAVKLKFCHAYAERGCLFTVKEVYDVEYEELSDVEICILFASVFRCLIML